MLSSLCLSIVLLWRGWTQKQVNLESTARLRKQTKPQKAKLLTAHRKSERLGIEPLTFLMVHSYIQIAELAVQHENEHTYENNIHFFPSFLFPLLYCYWLCAGVFVETLPSRLSRPITTLGSKTDQSAEGK